jgi:uncharacterized membrane protein YfcA
MGDITIFEVAVMLGAGFAAGTVNTIVGSGSLITFPTLLGLGYAPVVANVSNTVGMFPGSLSGAVGYRRELAGQRSRVVRLGLVAVLGGVTGGLLLIALPAEAFDRVIPFLILAACVLMAMQPRLSAILARRRRDGETSGALIALAVYLTAVYGGYFGAAQGVVLMAFLAILLTEDLQRLNGLKNVLVMLVNGVAALLFLVVAPIAWDAAVPLAVGAIGGGQLGAAIGRRIPTGVLRVVVVTAGTVVAVRLLLG